MLVMMNQQDIVRFIHEVGHLALTPRSGFAFLGSGIQSVAEHSYRTALVGWLLAHMSDEKVDAHKVVFLCLLHDLPEARTGDMNYVQKRYVHVEMDKVLEDFSNYSFFGTLLAPYIEEYEENQTIEARIAHDADQLELLFELKKLEDLGNKFVGDWVNNAERRLKTEEAKALAKKIWEEPYNNWWFTDKEDLHWVHGKGQQPAPAPQKSSSPD